MEKLSKFASSKEHLLRVFRESIEDSERFGGEANSFALSNAEKTVAVVDDRGATTSDVIHRSSGVWVEADIAIEGERGLARGADRVAWMLLVGKDRVVGPASALFPGADGDLR